MEHAHDQQFVWMPLVIDPDGVTPQLRTTAPERSREAGPSNSRSSKRSMHRAISASSFAAAVGLRSLMYVIASTMSAIASSV